MKGPGATLRNYRASIAVGSMSGELVGRTRRGARDQHGVWNAGRKSLFNEGGKTSGTSDARVTTELSILTHGRGSSS